MTTADSLYALGAYSDASLYYEKAYFFGITPLDKASSLIKKGQCYKQLRKYDAAEKTLLRIDYSDIPDILHVKARYETALCSYLSGNFTGAESQCIQTMLYIQDTSMYTSILPVYVLSLNELAKWDEAKKISYLLIRQTNVPELQKSVWKAEIDSMYIPKNYPRLRKEKTALRLATFLPGTGHWYAGSFGEGVASASLQLVGLAGAAYGIWTGYYITGVLAGYGFFQRFYMGGRERIKFLVRKKNNELMRHYNDPLKFKIMKIAQ